jgi:hypothetical protein
VGLPALRPARGHSQASLTVGSVHAASGETWGGGGAHRPHGSTKFGERGRGSM